MRLRPLLLVALLAPLAWLAGCAAPATTPAAQAVPAPQAHAAPAPATGAPAPGGTTPVKIDTRCKRDADCAIKDVGSCCGARPACVNADSPTDPAAVQAQCQASGRMGICGFRQINACQCQAGTCTPAADGTDLPRAPAPATEVLR